MALLRPFHANNLGFLLSKPIRYPCFPSQVAQFTITHLSNLLNSPFKCYKSGASVQLFDGFPEGDAVHSNLHVGNLTRRRRGEGEAESLTWTLHQGEGSVCSAVSCIVRAIRGTGFEDMKLGIHAVVIKIGYELEISIATALIGFYSSLHDLESARRLYYKTPTKDLILCSGMVTAYCRNRRFTEAIDIFREMQCFSVSLNRVSLLGVLLACANVGALLHGKQVHGYAMRREFHLETSLQNSLVDMYSKCGQMDDAIRVFNGIEGKDVISWKNAIIGCIESGQSIKALQLFYNLRSCLTEPGEIIVRNIITVCSGAGDPGFGTGLHCYVIKNGLSSSTSVGTSLLKLYAEFKDLEAAQALFDQLQHKDHVAWSAMVSVYSQTGHPALALEMFREMQLVKAKANEITMVSLLRACSLMEGQELGRSIHGYITRLGYSDNIFIVSALIDFYCKIGRLWQAEALFEKLQRRDLVCWSSMINGYGVNGCGVEAIQTFSEMLEHGLTPNEVVFVSLLSACSHCGLVDEGWKWFKSMEERFGVGPTLAHYTCIVDLLGRQGRVEEALRFVSSMPVEPDVSIWGALLSWCKTTPGDVESAKIAVDQLMQLDPSNTSYYVTLHNMYSNLGWWGEAERIRGFMEEKGLRKTAGYSIV